MGKRKRRKKNHLLELAIALMNLIAAILAMLVAIIGILKEFLND